MTLAPLENSSVFFFFNDTATTEIYTLSLHDALPICGVGETKWAVRRRMRSHFVGAEGERLLDRKSTRLNSSHGYISYAVFCLKKKKQSEHSVTMHLRAQHMLDAPECLAFCGYATDVT